MPDLENFLAQITPGNMLDNARTIALKEKNPILIVHGIIPPDLSFSEDSQDIITLISASPVSSQSMTAIYRVTDRKRIGNVIDQLADHGGFRCSLIEKNGEVHQGYHL